MDSSRTVSLPALSRLDEKSRAEYWAALALRHTRGLGARSICRLLKYFGSAYLAVHSVSRWEEAEVPSSRGESLSRGTWRNLARPEWESSRTLDGHILLWTDPAYPPLLKELPDAPALLYVRGDLSLLRNPGIAMVGSRRCSREGLHRTHTIARELSACGVTVISGLARGIDCAAHKASLPEQGRTIAALGSGLDVIYPPEHRELYQAIGRKGLLLSEFPPGTLPTGHRFPVRNRIISGLALAVTVVEAARRSGSLITARQALEQNRTVYAVPPPGYRPELAEDVTTAAKDGCTFLLSEGAKAVLSAADILDDLLPQLRGILDTLSHSREAETSLWSGADANQSSPPSSYDPLSPQGQILRLLRERGPLPVDDMLAMLPGQEAGTLSAILLRLEVDGAVCRHPGMIYEAISV